MRKRSKQERQLSGCGFEIAQGKTYPWTPQNLDPMWHAAEIDTCPGYSMNLPEVIEIARARVHWKEGGGLRDFCDDTPTERMRLGVEILEGTNNEVQRWAMDHPVKS